MSDVIDALGLSIVLLAIPWIVVQMGVGAVLAARYQLSPWVGGALGLIPIPFAGWLAVAALAQQRGTSDDWAIDTPDAEMPAPRHDDDGW